MASRASSAILLLVLFGVALLLQVALADVVGDAQNGDVVTPSSTANIDSQMTPADTDEDSTAHEVQGDVDEDQGMTEADQGREEELGEVQPYMYVPEAGNGDVIATTTKTNIDSNTVPVGIDQASTHEAEDVDDDQLPDLAGEGMSEADEVGEEGLGSADVANEGTTVEGDEAELGEIQPYVYVPEAGDVEVLADGDDQQQESSVEVGRPLARILHERSSKKCWSSKKCHKFYKSAGCCNKKCVNLATCNSHCGKCKKCCDTKKGYFCHSGKCRKRHAHKAKCHKKKDCKGGKSCCSGKCLDLEHDCKHCGKCGSKCPWGSACCDGHCKSLKTDCRNCGKCGRKCAKGKACCNGECVCLKQSHNHCGKCGKSCGWGRKCCHGKCVSVTSDVHNCGRCGKKCPSRVKCIYGICGYAH